MLAKEKAPPEDGAFLKHNPVSGSAIAFLAIGAVGGGLHVLGGAFDRVAGRDGQTAGNGKKDKKLTDHLDSPELMQLPGKCAPLGNGSTP